MTVDPDDPTVRIPLDPTRPWPTPRHRAGRTPLLPYLAAGTILGLLIGGVGAWVVLTGAPAR